MKFSLVIPVFNEAESIVSLIEEVYETIPAKMLGEVIIVDDCSSDDTTKEVTALKPKHKSLRILRHRSNAGQSAALRTGVLAAKHEIIAQLDGDGQNVPKDLVHMMDEIAKPGEDGPALIGGIRTNRKDTGSKRSASKIANKIRDWVLKDHCPDTGCGTKLYWREAFIRLPFFTSIHRYLPALFQTYGYQCKYVPVENRERTAGVSKYNNFNRALIGIYDLFGVTWLRKRTKAPNSEEL